MIKEFFYQSKINIYEYLKKYLGENKNLLNTLNKYWGKELSKKILDFSNQGKMIRGGLVLLGYQTFAQKKITENQIKISTAMELMHSSLLIHDDIMDRDIKRRGQMTVHEYYKKIGSELKLTDPKQFGLSTAICLGDIGFFLASDVLHSLTMPDKIKNQIINLFNHEIIKVGLAQQFEIFCTFSKKNITTKEVMSIYKFKTAQYTFSLPLKLGAISANASTAQLTHLDELGEKLGLIFQLHDDELGIFGNPEKTGKAVGSDIRENKKTLYYTNIFSNKKFKNKDTLRKLFNKKNISKEDIKKIKLYLINSGLFNKINTKKIKIGIDAQLLIKNLKTTYVNKKIYSELLEYNMKRQK